MSASTVDVEYRRVLEDAGMMAVLTFAKIPGSPNPICEIDGDAVEIVTETMVLISGIP
jgi:hypothetical protein